MNEIKEARIPSTPASIGTKNRVVSEVSKSESKSIGVRFALKEGYARIAEEKDEEQT